MLELIGGAELWQWDTGRQVDCADLPAGTKVQFAYSDTQKLSTTVKSVSGANVADVPNQMLIRSGALMVYAYVTEADGVSYTKYATRLNVQARPKPDDYVYTPTEVQSWQTIRDEIGDLDDLTTTAKNNLVAAINEAAASGGGGGGSVTKDSIVTALGYTPADAPDALICTISGAGTDASPYACDKTTAEIDAAIQAGKTVQAMLEGFYYPLVARTGVLSCAFAGAYKASSTVRTIIVTQNGTVMVRSINMEDAANKTTDLSASSTNTQYPGAKAVWDALPHPEAKTDAMTQAVGKDADGKLWTAPGGGGSSFAPTLVASLVADGTTSSIMQNIDIAYPAIYTVSIYAKDIADTDNAGQAIFALFGGKTQFEAGVTVRGIKTVNNTFTIQLVALTFALDAEKKIRTIGKAENNADSLTSWDNYAEGGTLTSNAILLYSSTNKIIPAGYKCDVWRWM